MTILKIFLALAIAHPAYAQLSIDKGALKPADQKYYKNDSNEGKSHYERIDSAVKEMNTLHAKINSLEADVALLKQEVELLKSKKK